MNNKNYDSLKIQELLLRLVEGDINDAGLSFLEGWFQKPGSLSAYWEFVKNYTAIKLFEESQMEGFGDRDLSSDDSQNMALWEALAENEKTAVAVEVGKIKEKSEETGCQPAEVRKIQPGVGRFSIYSLIISSAALFFILVYAYFTQISRGVEVATLVDRVDAKWADQQDFKSGTRFQTKSSPLLLREGYASFLFDNHVRITLESPCEIQFLTEDQIQLTYGRLYAIVPPEAIGFQVNTRNSKIIDLGTEFGIQEDSYGNTELHVIKGKANFFASRNGKAINIEVPADSAKKFEGRTGRLEDIPCDDQLFTRAINSKLGRVWRGPIQIDLADLVGGGNGYGSGEMGKGINPVTGSIGQTFESDRSGNGQYMAVPESRYIDGVFVPNNQGRPVLVSSKGHVFTECPSTNNIYYMEIIHTRTGNHPHLWGDTAAPGPENGQTGCPNIFMHANLGMTFDLDAIRADFAEAELTRFTAEAGLSPSATREGHVDVWVLVDGKVRYHQKGITEKGKAYPIEIPLEKTNHFLTLVTTDGGDVDYMEDGKRATDSDWALFARPRLELSMKNGAQ
jgi:hypothetical protein